MKIDNDKFEKELARAYLQGRYDAQRELYEVIRQMERELKVYKRKASIKSRSKEVFS